MVFYKPEDGWMGDVMPFYSDGRFYIYYLHDTRAWGEQVPGGHWGPVSCRLVSTADFVTFEEHGEALGRGAEGEHDHYYVFTGSVLKAEDGYHFFYTGHNPDMQTTGRPVQALMHATSSDLQNWRKIPADTFGPTRNVYEPNDWRDPYVFWNPTDNCYWMLVTARATNGPPSRRGCIVLFTSPDLAKWAERGTFWEPNLYINLECSQIFSWGDYWYLVYSTYSERWITHYRIANAIDGPWHAPINDSFDGRAFYAAKACSDGNNRYVFGWIPTRRDNNDHGLWEWGGNLLVHQLNQEPDGSLTVRPPEVSAQHYSHIIDFDPCGPQMGVSRGTGVLELSGQDRFSFAMGEALPTHCRIDGTVTFGHHTRGCGLILRASDDLEHAYYIRIEPMRNRLVMDAWPRRADFPFAPELERPIVLKPERAYRITVLVSDTICVTYLDNKIAMSFRMYQSEGSRLGIFCNEGSARFEDLVISS